ncbi:hypothetical protein BYT27DRAFT_7190620 [Phlegmacium glaucopus]|nr:hypothetical protein BYT27DRAFT_7190620 [Phlegmacium glaucopus]
MGTFAASKRRTVIFSGCCFTSTICICTDAATWSDLGPYYNCQWPDYLVHKREDLR